MLYCDITFGSVYYLLWKGFFGFIFIILFGVWIIYFWSELFFI